MNKLPKEIYVDEGGEESVFLIDPEQAARAGETRTLGVYKFVGKIEVSTQIKQEVVIKKQPKKTAKPVAVEVPERHPLLDELRVTN